MTLLDLLLPHPTPIRRLASMVFATNQRFAASLLRLTGVSAPTGFHSKAGKTQVITSGYQLVVTITASQDGVTRPPEVWIPGPTLEECALQPSLRSRSPSRDAWLPGLL